MPPRSAVTLALALTACRAHERGQPPASPTPPSPPPVTPAATCSRPVQPPTHPALADPSAALPDHRLLADPRDETLPPVYPAASGPPMAASDVALIEPDFWFGNPRVLDPGAGAADVRRVQFVCDDRGFRVAFWLDAGALRRTNRAETVLVGSYPHFDKLDERTPNVRIPAGGAQIVGTIIGQPVMRAVYDDAAMHVTGYVLRDAVDIVYEPTPGGSQTFTADGVLILAAEFRSAPYGSVFARVAPDGTPAIERLSTGWPRILVRYRGVDATILGWVDGRSFEPRPPWTVTVVRKGGGGGARLGGEPSIELAAGTLLVDETSSRVLGVVTQTDRFRCDDPCDASEPRVMIGCGYQLRLLAVRPGLPPCG